MESVFILLIRAYQALVSPILPFNQCRFYPTCSAYAIEALQKHGALKGLWMAGQRVLQCHPFHSKGGYDPVP